MRVYEDEDEDVNEYACETCYGEGVVECKMCQGEGAIVSPDAPKRYVYLAKNPNVDIPKKYTVTCPMCDGDRVVDCETCKGTGEKSDYEEEY